MSIAADRERNARQQRALPGGAHDRWVRILARWLPGLAGVVVAAMVIGPLFPRGEISFLLDRTKVAAVDQRLSVSDATYRGVDDKGRPFTVTAGSAVQVSAAEPLVTMRNLVARILMPNGPAELAAPDGSYDYADETVRVSGPVTFSAADGYRMTTSNVAINLKTRRAVGSGGVSGSGPAGTFRADRIVADLAERTVMLDGNARLVMTPGQLRMP